LASLIALAKNVTSRHWLHATSIQMTQGIKFAHAPITDGSHTMQPTRGFVHLVQDTAITFCGYRADHCTVTVALLTLQMTSPQAGQKSPVTAGMVVVSLWWVKDILRVS